MLFEDEYLLVADKRAGIPAIPDRHQQMENLRDILRIRYPEILVVHRLDQFTSGVMLFAKEPEAHRVLGQQFQDRSVTKHYLGIIQGNPLAHSGVIEAPIEPPRERPGTCASAWQICSHRVEGTGVLPWI